MNKLRYVILASLLAVGSIIASPNPVTPVVNQPTEEEETGLVWYSFDEGYNKAVKEDKIILIDAYTDWCGWCKVMDKKTYTQASVIEYLNENFVCVKLNPEVEKEYKFADKTMRSSELLQYLGHGKVTGYPTTIFWLHPTKEEQRFVQPGFLGPKDFLGLLKSAQAAKVKKS